MGELYLLETVLLTEANTAQSSRRYAISDITTSVSTVLTRHCFTTPLIQWIMWGTRFCSFAVLILIDSSKVELERIDSPLWCLIIK